MLPPKQTHHNLLLILFIFEIDTLSFAALSVVGSEATTRMIYGNRDSILEYGSLFYRRHFTCTVLMRAQVSQPSKTFALSGGSSLIDKHPPCSICRRPLSCSLLAYIVIHSGVSNLMKWFHDNYRQRRFVQPRTARLLHNQLICEV